MYDTTHILYEKLLDLRLTILEREIIEYRKVMEILLNSRIKVNFTVKKIRESCNYCKKL